MRGNKSLVVCSCNPTSSPIRGKERVAGCLPTTNTFFMWEIIIQHVCQVSRAFAGAEYANGCVYGCNVLM